MVEKFEDKVINMQFTMRSMQEESKQDIELEEDQVSKSSKEENSNRGENMFQLLGINPGLLVVFPINVEI